MSGFLRPSYVSPMRIWLARGVALAADALQIAVFPLFSEGFISPFSIALDVVVAMILTLLVGWHIAFVPTIIIEQLPMVELAPTWTIAAWIATAGKRATPPPQHDKFVEPAP